VAKGRFRKGLENWWTDTSVGDKFSGYAAKKASRLEQDGIDENPSLMEFMRQNAKDLPGVGEDLDKSLSGKNPLGIIAIVSVLVGTWLSIIMSGFTPIADLFRYLIQRVAFSARLNVVEMIQPRWRFGDDILEVLTDLADLGYDPVRLDALINIIRPRVNEEQLTRLFRREVITPEFYADEMKSRGWDEADKQHFLAATEFIPGVNDLIQMAVREAFNDDAIDRFQLLGDFDTFPSKEAEQLGLSQFWQEKFWIQHWRLPGIGQAIEMRQRLREGRQAIEFSAEDLTAYLRAADISPRFRPLIEQIAFRTMTRVDIKRAFAIGEILPAEVKERYLDLGYDEATAIVLTAIATNEGKTNERDLTISAIQRAYRKRVWERPETIAELMKRGYDANEADVLLTLIDIDLEEDRKEDVVDTLELQYMEGEITEAQLRAELGATGVEVNEAEFIVDKLNAKLRRRIKIPSVSMLEDFYEDDIITRDVFKTELGKRGWDVQRTEWLTERFDLDTQRRAEREAERARKEADRLQSKTETTAFRLDKSKSDVIIADLKVDIADLKVMLATPESEEDEAELKLQIAELKQEIAVEKTVKARRTQERFE